MYKHIFAFSAFIAKFRMFTLKVMQNLYHINYTANLVKFYENVAFELKHN